MPAVKIRNIPGLHFGQRPNGQPLGPSVSGGLSVSSKLLTQPQPVVLSSNSGKKIRPLSDDSSDSSSIGGDSAQKWPKNAMQILRSRMRQVEATVVPDSQPTSIWERTKKTQIGVDDSIVPSPEKNNKRKSKRHRSLEAKTARYYAKREQTGWTPQLGRKGSTTSSDDEGGFKMRREMSPRRKRGSREGSSVSSRNPSRDASVAPPAANSRNPSRDVSVAPTTLAAPTPRPTRVDRLDLPPSSTGVPRRSPAVAPKPISMDFKPTPVPTIKITAENEPPSLKPSMSAGRRTSSEALTIEEWISTRPLSKSGQMTSSTQSLVSSPYRPESYAINANNTRLSSQIRPLSHAQSHMEISSLYQSSKQQPGISKPIPFRSPSHTDLSRYSASSALSSSPPSQNNANKNIGGHIQVNGVSSSVSSASQWNQPMSRYSLPAGMDERAFGFPPKPEPISPESVSNKRNFFEQLRKKSVDSGSSEPTNKLDLESPVCGRRETGRLALALSSAKSTELLPIGGHVAADSRFLHHAIQTSSQAAMLLNDIHTTPSQSGRSPTEDSDSRSRVRWNSDWQLHQSSSGIYRPIANSQDSTRLNVPSRSRLAPLKESDQRELEQALEELDEFYESISTKSEDLTLKSSAGLRSDSGVSSPRQIPSSAVMADITKKNLQEKDRQEYTKQWIHQGTSERSPTGGTVGASTAGAAGSPTGGAIWSSGRDNSNGFRQSDRKRGQSLGENNCDRRTHKDDFANPYTPTVFTGSALEFQNYPGTNKPQPHIEMDDLSLRKIIHSQNTPYYRVTADLPKQLPSSRNDYAVPNVAAAKGSSTTADSVRDDAAFRLLRNDQKLTKDQRPQNLAKEQRPQTLALASEKNVTKVRSISNSIKNLAKQFERPKEEAKVGGVSVNKIAGLAPSRNILHAAVQINGQKVAVRSPSATAKTTSVSATKTAEISANQKIQQKSTIGKISPKISPMDDKQMDDLLLSLNSLSSSQTKNSAENSTTRNQINSSHHKKSENSTVAKMFGLSSRTNIAMAV